MEERNDVGMQYKTQDKLSKALELARSEGFAVVGFALRPDDNAMMQINNQGMEPMQFLVFMQTAIKAYMTSLPDATLRQLEQVQVAEA